MNVSHSYNATKTLLVFAWPIIGGVIEEWVTYKLDEKGKVVSSTTRHHERLAATEVRSS